jgi:hypothetical protein
LPSNFTASAAVSLSVVAASICTDIFATCIMFKANLISEVKFLASLLVSAMNIPDNTVIELVRLNSVNQGQKLSSKTESGIFGSKVVVNNRSVEHDVFSTFYYVFVSFCFVRNIILF